MLLHWTRNLSWSHYGMKTGPCADLLAHSLAPLTHLQTALLKVFKLQCSRRYQPVHNFMLYNILENNQLWKTNFGIAREAAVPRDHISLPVNQRATNTRLSIAVKHFLSITCHKRMDESWYSNFAESDNFETGSGTHSARMALIFGNGYFLGIVANFCEEVMQGQGFVPVFEDPSSPGTQSKTKSGASSI